MANQDELSRMLQEITRLIRSGQFSDNNNIDPGMNINANKGPAPVDPRQMADFMAQFGAQGKSPTLSSQYDPKKPGSSWLGINSDYASQFGDKPGTGGAMTKPGLPQDGAMFIEKQPLMPGTASQKPLPGHPGFFMGENWMDSLYPSQKSPVIPRAPKGETVRLSPGLYRDDKGNIVNKGAQKPAMKNKRKA